MYADTYLPSYTTVETTNADGTVCRSVNELLVPLGYVKNYMVANAEVYADGYEDPDEYKQAVEKAFDQIQALEQRLPKREINIAILNSKSLNDLARFADNLEE